jgi:anaerobic magnesium-protoporphyrin IX monomethyl ester cyclase
MKILLTTLHSRFIHASLALPYLKAYCQPLFPAIQILELTLGQPKENLLARIVAADAEVICFSVYLWNRMTTLELVGCLKRINPDCRIVLGGPDISFESADFFLQYPVDAIICGEGEIPLRHLLTAWRAGVQPAALAGLQLPGGTATDQESLLEPLDQLPSPFVAGLVDLSRGLVYYESSRGCPYRCSFCLSALSTQVRSFSMERIRVDLGLLMDQQVKLIKFVDRTFNYNAERTREIFRFILAHNRSSTFHFEIGAHLLDETTLHLLEQVPPGVFQFEIGVQAILPETLQRVSRSMALDLLADNVRALRERTHIHLHLDLVAGLPGGGLPEFFAAIDWTYALGADHLQIELVKLLPGTPLRRHAAEQGICYDPTPPYGVLATAEWSFAELERVRGISRLNDLLVNSGKFPRLIAALVAISGSLARSLDELNRYWCDQQLHAGSRSLRQLAEELGRYVGQGFCGTVRIVLREALARDYAHSERVVAGSAPVFFDQRLTPEEQAQVRQRVKNELNGLERHGKVQFFSSIFYHLPEAPGRRVVLFIYVSKTTAGVEVEELML